MEIRRKRGRPKGSSNRPKGSPKLSKEEALAGLRKYRRVTSGLSAVRQRRTDAVLDAILATLTPEQRRILTHARGNPMIESAVRGLCASLLQAEDMISAQR
jgi:hypothetical protein